MSQASAPRHTAPHCPLCDGPGGEVLWADRALGLRCVRATDAPLPQVHRLILADHITEFSALSPGQRAAVMEQVAQLETQLIRTVAPDKMNLASLGNQVAHLHWHLIPRFRTDPFWPNSIWSAKTPGTPFSGGGLICDWEAAEPVARPLRRAVFIEEQGVPEEEEFEEADAWARHGVVMREGRCIATGRLLSSGRQGSPARPSARIGRMAVDAQHRREGLGACLLTALIEEARRLGFAEVVLHAQVQAADFYVRLGFESEGEAFEECGIQHRLMRRPV